MKASDLPKLAAKFPQKDIHWRAQTVTRDGKKALALAYIDARDVMDRLDEVCGPEGWQTRHKDVGGGKLACEIGIHVDGEWIWKSDGAGATDVEGDKGAFSDSLKRAAVGWGVARYLYDMGNTYVPCEAEQFNGKWRFKKFTDDPWNYVRRKDGPAQPVLGKLNKTKLQEELRKFNDDLRAASDLDSLAALLEKSKAILDQCQEDLPNWWFTKDAPDASPGFAERIGMKREELEKAANHHPGLTRPNHQAAE